MEVTQLHNQTQGIPRGSEQPNGPTVSFFSPQTHVPTPDLEVWLFFGLFVFFSTLQCRACLTDACGTADCEAVQSVAHSGPCPQWAAPALCMARRACTTVAQKSASFGVCDAQNLGAQSLSQDLEQNGPGQPRTPSQLPQHPLSYTAVGKYHELRGRAPP